MKWIKWVIRQLNSLLTFGKIIVLKGWGILKFFLLNKYVRCTLVMFWTIWPIIILVTLLYLALNLMDQVRDLLDALVQNGLYSFFAVAGVFALGILTWYVTSILFVLKNQHDLAEIHIEEIGMKTTSDLLNAKKELNLHLPTLDEYSLIDTTTLAKFTFYTPVFLGSVPFLAFLLALKKIDNSGFLLLVIGVVFIIYLSIAYSIRIFSDTKEEKFTALKFSLLSATNRFIVRYGTYLAILFVASTALKFTVIFISSSLGPICVIFLGFSVWIVIAGYLNFLDYSYRTPFTVVCLCLVMLFDNNNHQIRTVETSAGSYMGKNEKNTVPEHFKNWINLLISERTDVSSL